VFVLLAGRPEEESFLEDLQDLEASMRDARSRIYFNEESSNHRRGKYPMKSTGISYGGGSKVSSSSLLTCLHR